VSYAGASSTFETSVARNCRAERPLAVVLERMSLSPRIGGDEQLVVAVGKTVDER
jgi:hypothetical protein